MRSPDGLSMEGCQYHLSLGKRHPPVTRPDMPCEDGGCSCCPFRARPYCEFSLPAIIARRQHPPPSPSPYRSVLPQVFAIGAHEAAQDTMTARRFARHCTWYTCVGPTGI